MGPTSVDAVGIETDKTKLYAMKSGVLYLYDATCEADCTFTFVTSMVFTANDPGYHPFYAAPGSPVAAPPAGVHALGVLENVVLAYVGDDLYHYNRTSQYWTLAGKFHCV